MVIDDNGEKLGVLSLRDALSIASEKELDLVEVSPGATPPVCKIMDHGKHLYQMKKKQKSSAKAKPLKQIEFRPSTGDADFEVKVNQVKKFLSSGHKVKISVKFRGRELSHRDIGQEKIEKAVLMVSDIGKKDGSVSMEGRKMSLVLSPQ